MNVLPRKETARIYRFPLKGRSTASDDRATPRPSTEASTSVATDFGSGWYHEAAMQDADQGRKH